MVVPCFLLIALCYVTSVQGGATGWNYEEGSEYGPQHWADHFTDCGGVMQSPIDVQSKFVLHDPTLTYFDFTDYAKTEGIQMSLHNMGGHTVEVMYAGTPMYLNGGSLPHKYQLDQFHFHWGLQDNRGSEHGVNGQHFPMEMHIVHHLASIENSSVAMQHPYGLAVVGFFFEIGLHNHQFDQLLSHFKSIANPGQNIEIPAFRLADLLPGKGVGNLDFYRYMGSLTTPPCFETVIWSLGTENIVISEEQINVFRGLFQDTHGHALGDDFRPLQPMNRRTVTTTLNSNDKSYHQNLSRKYFCQHWCADVQ